jgi:hypothetical protein
MAAIYSNGGNRWNILGFNFTKRDALSSVCKISMVSTQGWNYSWVIQACVVVTIYYNFFTSGNQCREHRAFQPFEIVHVIGKKFNLVNFNRAEPESNPGVESAPCNRSQSLQFLRGITMGNMCPHFYVVRGFSNMYIQGLSGHHLLVYCYESISK